MRVTRFGQQGFKSSTGMFRTVAIRAQMRKKKMLQPIAGDLGDQRRRRPVGKVSLITSDALFEAPRAVRFVQKRLVVVGFDDHCAAFTQPFAQCIRYHPDVRGDADHQTSGRKDKPDRIVGIVRHRKRMNGKIADRKRRSGGKPRAPNVAADTFECSAIGIDRNAVVFLKHPDSRNVVTMFVAHADGVDILHPLADIRQPFRRFTRRKPRIDQNAGVFRADKRAIAGTAAG